MSFSTFLGVLGVVATIAFGVWAVILGIRHQYPGQLTFVREKTIALFDEIAKNLPLKILYNEEPVSPDIVLVEGSLVNTGKKDIAKSMIAKSLKVSLPENGKWLSAKVIKASTDLVVTLIKTDDRSLEVQSDLIRCGEFIRFQALAEMPKLREHPPSKLLSFDHRIEDTQEIRSIRFKSEEITWKSMFLPLSLLLGILVGIATNIYTFRDEFFPRKASSSPEDISFHEFAFMFHTANDKTIKVFALPLSDSRISVQAVDGSFSNDLPKDEFLSRIIGPPSLEKRSIPTSELDRPRLNTGEKIFFLFIGSLTIGIIIYNIYSYQRYRTSRKLARLIQIT